MTCHFPYRFGVKKKQLAAQDAVIEMLQQGHRVDSQVDTFWGWGKPKTAHWMDVLLAEVDVLKWMFLTVDVSLWAHDLRILVVIFS